uniref:Uncharacterized protein n=1 Tax=Anopheles atroparvus TaxID=41427 RepID=A0A182JF40_ANOAO
MTKFICIVLALVCLGAATVHAQYKTDVQCASLSECICKLPTIIGAVAGRTASASIRNPANGQTYTLDLSRPSQAVVDYCRQRFKLSWLAALQHSGVN